jgi:hypothetical protein
VRRRLTPNELLRAVREGRVSKVLWFTKEDSHDEVAGVVLVEFSDGTPMGQAYVDPDHSHR